MRGSYILEYEVTPTVTNGAYSAGDVVGGLITMPVQTAGGWCLLTDIVVIDDSNALTDVTAYVFNDVPTTRADNAAAALAIGDLAKLVEVWQINSFLTINSNKWGRPSVVTNANRPISVPKANLYIYIVDNVGATLNATSAVTVRAAVLVEGQ